MTYEESFGFDKISTDVIRPSVPLRLNHRSNIEVYQSVSILYIYEKFLIFLYVYMYVLKYEKIII